MFKKVLIVSTVAIISLGIFKSANTDSHDQPGEALVEWAQDKKNVPIIINPVDRAKFSSPITGFIDHMPFKAGTTFKKGETLVEYNCTVMVSEKEKAKAVADHLKEKAHDMEKLFHLGGTSRNDYMEATSQAKGAQEELTIKSYIVSQCLVKAPFDGQVVDLFASPHEYIEQGKPLIEVVNLKNLEIKLILPSEWLSWIKEGSQFNIKLNETNLKYPAKITRITYAIDPVSNTFTAFATFIQTNEDVKPGMSGYADFGKP